MELSTRYDARATEQKWYSEWESRNYFHADAQSPKSPYCIVIPPPNITGILHMGHALNNTLQDVLIRWKRMAGYEALWVPGTDHASIATQYVVERKLLENGTSRREIGREKFLQHVWEWKEKHGGIIIQQLKRLGSSCDWARERFTMDEGLNRAVITVFKRLYDEGLIYRGNNLVNWCPRCLTTLADDEVDYSEKAGKLWYLRYPVEGAANEFAVVATTRPETMLGDSAIAVNPSDDRYKKWIGKHAILPLVNRRIPIIADDFVDKTFGTGMVKITPAHDPNDYAAGKRHGLEEINIFTPDAKINEVAPQYKGLDRYEARKRIIADLELQNLVEKIEDYTQRAGHCYRCNAVVEPYVSLQWFVKIRPLAEPARKAVADGKIKFIPKSRERDYFHWVDNLRDWAISRQLWWGHRIPAWYCACGETIVTDTPSAPEACTKCGSADLAQDPDVLDTWFSSALWPFSTLGWPDKTAELQKFYPTSALVTAKDIIFFWVARMIMMGLHFMKDVPFHDVYFNPIVGDEHGKKMSKSKGNAIDPIELMDEYGTDALRFTLCDYATQEQHIAFSVKRCEGYRNFMNKLWNASRLIFSNVEDLRRQEIADVVPLGGPELRSKMPLEDRWILSQYARTVNRVNEALANYDFDIAVKAIYDFIWKDFCDYYLELAKKRLYLNKHDVSASPGEIRSRSAAQAMLVVILEGSLRLLHPFCPFITEELWSVLRQKWGETVTSTPLNSAEASGVAPAPVAPAADAMMHGVVDHAHGVEAFLGHRTLDALVYPSIMVAPWNDFAPAELIQDEVDSQMSLLQEVIYAIRNVRGEMRMPPGTAARITMVTPDVEVRRLLDTQASFFTTLTNVRSLEVRGEIEPPAFASMAVAAGTRLFVELPPEMQAQETERLQKELTRLNGEKQRLEGKLSNKGFTAKAPAEVIAKDRDKLNSLTDECMKIEAKLAQLKR
jgi:valyl-tRNA synthetase